MDTNFFALIDIVKGALLSRMEREAKLVLADKFLTSTRRAQTITLYERIGNNFVTYIADLHKVRTPSFLFVLARNAVRIFQDNLDKVWIFAYDGHCSLINWLPTQDKTEETIDEF